MSRSLALVLSMAVASVLAACGSSASTKPHSTRVQRSAPRIDPAVLRLARDSFAMRFVGMPEGAEVHEYARTATGYRYTSAFRLGPSFRRALEVELDSSLRVTRARHVTQAGAHRIEADFVYEGRRARGSITASSGSSNGASAPRVSIDTLLPDGAFDGLALYPKLLGRRWSVGQQDTLLLLDTDEMTVTRQTVRVVGIEPLRVAGAAASALRLELSTTQLPVTLWLSTDVPHRLLQVGSVNGTTVLVR